MSYYKDFIETLSQLEKDSFPYSLVPSKTKGSYTELLDMSFRDIRSQQLVSKTYKDNITNSFIASVVWEQDDPLMVVKCNHRHPTRLQNKRTASKHVSITSAENCAKAMVAQIRNLIPPNGWMGIQEAILPDNCTTLYGNLTSYLNDLEPSNKIHAHIKDNYTYDKVWTEIINKYAQFWTNEVQALFGTDEPEQEQITYHISPVMIDGRRMFIVINPDDEPVTDPVAHRGEVFALCRELNSKENT